MVLKALAHLAETAVFAYMGVDFFAITGAGVDAFAGAHALANQTCADETVDCGEAREHERANVVAFVFFALAVTLLARVIVIGPLCIVANCFRGSGRRLSKRASAMMIFAGLRGAIAFALAHNVHSAHRASIAAATTTVVLVTVFVLGGFTRTALRVLHMEAPTGHGGDDMLQGARSDDPEAVVEGGATSSTRREDGGGNGQRRAAGQRRASRWRQLDERYLIPILTNRQRRVGAPLHGNEPFDAHEAQDGMEMAPSVTAVRSSGGGRGGVARHSVDPVKTALPAEVALPPDADSHEG